MLEPCAVLAPNGHGGPRQDVKTPSAKSPLGHGQDMHRPRLFSRVDCCPRFPTQGTVPMACCVCLGLLDHQNDVVIGGRTCASLPCRPRCPHGLSRDLPMCQRQTRCRAWCMVHQGSSFSSNPSPQRSTASAVNRSIVMLKPIAHVWGEIGGDRSPIACIPCISPTNRLLLWKGECRRVSVGGA